MTSTVAWSIVGLAGLYFLALGTVSLLFRPIATRYFLGFAGSRARHYVELAIRMAVGAAFIAAATQAPWPRVFQAFGWLLIGTTTVLFLVPWRTHQRFAQGSVPRAMKYLPLLSGVSLIAGLVIMASIYRAISA